MDKLASQITQEYKQGLSYKRAYMSQWEECEKFFAGEQWPPVTKKTKNLPRPVFNILDFIVEHKVYSVCNTDLKLIWDITENLGEEYKEAAKIFSSFSEAVWDDLKQDAMNTRVATTSATTGTGYVHFYWDTSESGGTQNKWIGKLNSEEIDPIDIFLSDYQQRDIQRQSYVMITYRDLISNIKAEAQRNGVSQEKLQLINGDNDTVNDYAMAKTEVSGSEKATVITKYWKEDGKVLFNKVCGDVVIKESTDTQLTRYPIACLHWKERKKSCFGTGEVKNLIPNQKLINLIVAMQSMNIILTGFPKLEVDRQYIAQNITNQVGEILYNNDTEGKPHARYVNPPSMANQAFNVLDTIMANTKNLSGATETSTGELNKSDMNATAINLLLKQARIPIDGIRNRFHDFVEDIGLIWEQFFKIYYNTTRTFKVKDINDNDVYQEFNGEQFKDSEFALKIDVGASSEYSDSLTIDLLDKFLEGQFIDFKTYLELMPKSVVPFKEKLLLKVQENPMMGMNIEEILSQLSPEEQQAFKNAPPEIQQQLISQIGG